jgi:hypothetical protein
MALRKREREKEAALVMNWDWNSLEAAVKANDIEFVRKFLQLDVVDDATLQVLNNKKFPPLGHNILHIAGAYDWNSSAYCHIVWCDD